MILDQIYLFAMLQEFKRNSLGLQENHVRIKEDEAGMMDDGNVAQRREARPVFRHNRSDHET